MLKDIDKLPQGPDWEVQTIEVEGNTGTEVVEFWRRNPLDTLKRMLVDPDLKDHLTYAPVRHYTGPDRKTRRRGEAWTSDLVWNMQVSCIRAFKRAQTHQVK